MQELRDRSAAEQERFERRVTQLEEKQENVSEWFNSQVQELDMNLQNAQEELRLSQQQLQDSEVERKQRIQSMISMRGLDTSQPRYSESAVSDVDQIGTTADKIIEDHLEKEQQLSEQVRRLTKQINELEREVTFANQRNQSIEEDAVEARKHSKKLEKESEELIDKLTDLQRKNNDLDFELKEAVQNAKEDQMMHQMAMHENQ